MDVNLLIQRLGRLNSLVEYGPLLASLRDGGMLSALCRGSSLLTFLFLMLALAEDVVLHKGAMHIGASLRRILPKAILIGILFGSAPLYTALVEQVLRALRAISDWAFADAISRFQADFRFALSSIAAKSRDGVSFFSPEAFTAPLDVLLLSLSCNLVVALFFALVSYPPMFIVIAFASGPILIPFCLFSPFRNILEKWVLFLCASGLFTFFIGIGLRVLVDTHLFVAFAETGFGGALLPALVALFAVIAFMFTIPIVLAFLFGIPSFNVLPTIFAGISLAFGLIPVFAKVFALARVQKKAAAGGA